MVMENLDQSSVSMKQSAFKSSFYFFILILFISNVSASNGGLQDELRFIHQEIGSLREENQNQNIQIDLLKDVLGLQGNQMLMANPQTYDDDQRKDHKGNKRPARLLPLRILLGERKNDTDYTEPRRFYGPPTNCSELGLLGYTLNGYYLVSSKPDNVIKFNGIKVEPVYCAFKQPDGTFNKSGGAAEKRFISILEAESNSRSGSGVYFNVRLLHPFKVFKKDIKITFTDAGVILNIGNAFNPSTGEFHVPKTGIYQFALRVTCSLFPKLTESSYLLVQLYLNSSKTSDPNNLGTLEINKNNQQVSHFIQTNVKLNRGDLVYASVTNYTGSSPNVDFQLSSGWDTWFMGSFLEAM